MASSASSIQQGTRGLCSKDPASGSTARNRVTDVIAPRRLMAHPLSSGRQFGFGPFIDPPEQQRLLRDETAVALGSRAMEVLAALVESRVCWPTRVARSLVMAEAGSRPPGHRLLRTTRCCALKLLTDHREHGFHQARYADYYRAPQGQGMA